MAFQAAPNTAQATIKFHRGGVNLVNTMDFEKPDGFFASDLVTLAVVVGAWVVSSLMTKVDSSTIYDGVEIKGLNASVDFTASNTTGAGTAGSGATGNANNVAKAISLHSSLSGRNSRGRIFIGGIPTNAQPDENHINQSWIDDVVGFLEALKTAVEAIGWVWVIVSRFVDGVKRTTAVNFPVTTFSAVNNTTDSMRSRLPKT